MVHRLSSDCHLGLATVSAVAVIVSANKDVNGVSIMLLATMEEPRAISVTRIARIIVAKSLLMYEKALRGMCTRAAARLRWSPRNWTSLAS